MCRGFSCIVLLCLGCKDETSFEERISTEREFHNDGSFTEKRYFDSILISTTTYNYKNGKIKGIKVCPTEVVNFHQTTGHIKAIGKYDSLALIQAEGKSYYFHPNGESRGNMDTITINLIQQYS